MSSVALLRGSRKENSCSRTFWCLWKPVKIKNPKAEKFIEAIMFNNMIGNYLICFDQTLLITVLTFSLLVNQLKILSPSPRLFCSNRLPQKLYQLVLKSNLVRNEPQTILPFFLFSSSFCLDFFKSLRVCVLCFQFFFSYISHDLLFFGSLGVSFLHQLDDSYDLLMILRDAVSSFQKVFPFPVLKYLDLLWNILQCIFSISTFLKYFQTQLFLGMALDVSEVRVSISELGLMGSRHDASQRKAEIWHQSQIYWMSPRQHSNICEFIFSTLTTIISMIQVLQQQSSNKLIINIFITNSSLLVWPELVVASIFITLKKKKLSQWPAVEMQHAPANLPSKLHMFAYVDVLAQSLCILSLPSDLTTEFSWDFLHAKCRQLSKFLLQCTLGLKDYFLGRSSADRSYYKYLLCLEISHTYLNIYSIFHTSIANWGIYKGAGTGDNPPVGKPLASPRGGYRIITLSPL
ncbi:hypothetical protein VP01_316g3 [Puccinia sorghi]|uniref:Uncharacterized protein n=1 Tax=Puccinia sorghi TaxID=27349 RepID=A0A0L6UYP2_9BASI|nr:hypothetical protein VP01_316g3 [Puccinia sorghi]